MKRFVLLFGIMIILSGAAYSAEDPVARAMKLYEKRHYEEAAAVLRGEMSSLDPSKLVAAHLTLGMIYLKNAELHRELYQASLAATQDYLKKVAAAKGSGRGRFVDLYMGEALLEAGKAEVAAIYLEKFAADEGVESRYRAVANADLGLSYYRSGDTQKAEAAWAGVDASDPEVKAELAAAYSRAGISEKNPVGLCDESLAAARKSGKTPSIRLVKNVLAVYARAGLTDKGLDLARRADLKSSSYSEALSKTKVLNFYDLSLLADLATLYGQASVAHLEKAVADARYKDPAEYYLGEAHALFGSIDQSVKVTASFISTAKMPQQYKDKIRVWQAANQHQKGRQVDAMGVWDELSRKQPPDPDLLAEILFSCNRVKANCPQIALRAEAAAAAGEGKRFNILNYALGKYHLGKRDQQKALTHMEAGRDKSNKNKIEANDPAMLVNLAGLYYRGKKFSEALEIYFEMSKQFPAVRQIQEAVQGVYATEQKSAGDVKIF